MSPKMRQWLKEKKHAFHRPKSPRPLQAESQAGQTPVDPTPISTALANQHDAVDKQGPSMPHDLWESAYAQLCPKERDILSKVQATALRESVEEGRSQTVAVIDEVIQITEQQYREYQQGGIKIQRSTGEDIDLRKLSRKILNAALSFKDIVSTVVSFDPTHHAASAWAVVSLGLSMTQNRLDLRDALFESSEFLAGVLSRCAYIENNFYQNNTAGKSEIERAIIEIYKAILRYAAELLAVQNASVGRRILDSVTLISDQRLMELRTSIENEWQKLCQWVQLDALDNLLQNDKQAGLCLARIDEEVSKVVRAIQNFSLPVAEGAYYNSYANEADNRCLARTRVELLSQISEWAESCEGKHIFWLNGMAGTGKSTIARTVAHSFDKDGTLGASFFFKRGEADRGNAKRLISTITKDLMTRVPQLVPGVLAAIERDPNISLKALSQQFDTLLLRPLLNLKQHQLSKMVIVIDALDECEEDDTRVLLQLLPQLQKSESIHLRIFLTSRPELPIRHGFKQNDNHQDLVLHELPIPVIERDIRLFLRARLSNIRDENSLLPDWPRDDEIEKLVDLSVPLFIFAATVCRFIGDGKRSPTKRLATVLQSEAVAPAAQMERVYQPVLKQILNDEDVNESQDLAKEFRDIVGVIIFLATPLSVHTLGRLLSTPVEDIHYLLNKLHSVLSVQENINAPVRILHLSFREFLVKTKGVFHIEERETHRKIFSHCLGIISSRLKQNICCLSGYGTQRGDIEGHVISQHIPPELEYCCHYWVYHLEQARSQEWEADIFAFLKEHFLHWLETMSLIGLAPEAIGIINTLQSVFGGNISVQFAKFLQDAARFIVKYVQIINNAPLQVYCSGLVFSPTDSIIRRTFDCQRPCWIAVLPQVEKSWSAELQTLEGHSHWVQSVAFSPDGQKIVSGSSDETIKLWDAQTGLALQTLEGHSHWVQSVAFSPDGQKIVSGSSDETIKLWDAQTGLALQTLKSHSHSVQSVAFSPDGQKIVSGSSDNTIKLWDAQTGLELQTFKSHSDSEKRPAKDSGQTRGNLADVSEKSGSALNPRVMLPKSVSSSGAHSPAGNPGVLGDMENFAEITADIDLDQGVAEFRLKNIFYHSVERTSKNLFPPPIVWLHFQCCKLLV
ncbi:hypothetical protein BDW62DRAFT_206493 [Aspergillus aurantiobrunneus]